MEKYERIFTIGTDRIIEECIESYCNEIHYLEKKTGAKVPLVIIDESDDCIQSRNLQFIKKFKKNNDEISIYYLDKKQQDIYFEKLRNMGIPNHIIDLLNFEDCSYGRLLNKQFLFATALGASYIHRRDSDTTLLDECGFPADYEIEYLGKEVGKLEEAKKPQNISFDYNSCIMIVGSGYSGGGEWKTDYYSLLPDDCKCVVELNRLLGVPDDIILEYLCEMISGYNFVTEPVKFLPRLKHSNPDCGNIAFYKLHNYLPVSPIKSTPGSDYFLTYLLKNNCSPIIYHNNFVSHKYTAERKNRSESYVKKYWVKLIMMYDYYYTFFECILSKTKKLEIDFSKPESIDVDSLVEIMIPESVDKTERIKRIIKFSDIISKSKNHLVVSYSKAFREESFINNIMLETDTGIKNHAILLQCWSEIIKCAQKIEILAL